MHGFSASPVQHCPEKVIQGLSSGQVSHWLEGRGHRAVMSVLFTPMCLVGGVPTKRAEGGSTELPQFTTTFSSQMDRANRKCFLNFKRVKELSVFTKYFSACLKLIT